MALTEPITEQAVLKYAGNLEYPVLYGPDIAPGEPAQERAA